MSWPILLAEYPKSLFENKLALIALVVLERSGLTTEEELAQQIKIDQFTLSKSLLDLHQNQFIIFGRNSVRISERGKMLLDRLKLHDGIVEDLLDALSLQGRERAAYHNVLVNYRDTAFPQYLNSLCTMRTWRTIADCIPLPDKAEMKKGEKKNLKQPSNNFVLFTILLRDLRNWRIHSNPPEDVFDALNENIRLAITSDKPEGKITVKHSSTTGKALSLLKILQSKQDQKDWQSITKAEVPLVQSFIILNNFQKGWERDNWYDAWCDVSPDILESRKGTSQFLKYLETHLPDAESNRILVAWGPYAELGSSTWWSGEPKGENISNFLPKMMLASSVDDLAAVTGISKDSITSILSNIQEKCRTLLKDTEANQNKSNKSTKK